MVWKRTIGRQNFTRFLSVSLLLLGVGWPSNALALDGANPLEVTPLASWKAFELVTRGDDISAVSDANYESTASRENYDGLGAYRNGDQLRVWLNHESFRAAISRVDLDLQDFQQAIASTIDDGTTPFPTSMVTGMGYAYDAIYDANYHAINQPIPVTDPNVIGLYSGAFFRNFCSGTSYTPNSFGNNRGFVDPIYITGEELFGANGQLFALDEATRDLWEVADVGLASWENAALVDTGNTTHVALLLNSDEFSSPGAPLRLYVGEKNVDTNADGEVDFLERNGLRGGTTYFFEPDAGFDTDDLPSGQVTGTWSTSSVNALRDTRIEDIHVNPHNGTQATFAASDDGLYTMDVTLSFSGGSLDAANSSTTIEQIFDLGGPIGSPDNLTWSSDGQIYVQEDGPNGIWRVTPDGTEATKIAQASGEPSGIIDISDKVGYRPGSVFLTSVMGADQLATLISPDATLACDFTDDFACLLVDVNDLMSQGDLVAGVAISTSNLEYELHANGDSANVIDEHDLSAWLAQAAVENGFMSPYLRGDTDLDRDVDITDFNFLVVNFEPDGNSISAENWHLGNFDGDGDIDITDFNLLAMNFAASGYGGVGGQTVPESSSLLLSFIGLSIFSLVGPVISGRRQAIGR